MHGYCVRIKLNKKLDLPFQPAKLHTSGKEAGLIYRPPYRKPDRVKAMTTSNSSPISFTRINNDTNGNPRYVCHFLALNTEEELVATGDDWVSNKYDLACTRAKKVGGKRFHNKQYGGGIVFQSYSLADEVDAINRITGRTGTEHAFTGYVCS